MKQVVFILMMLLLPVGMMAQVDDLYYVPTKKKAKKEIRVAPKTVVVPETKSVAPAGTTVQRIGKGTKGNIVNGMDEDAYNRRGTSAGVTGYAEDYSDEYTAGEYVEEEYVDEVDVDADYTYSSRIVRFHSPRRAVVLSSPLYWDVVYNCGIDNWTIYDDGIYWDVYPDYGYTAVYTSPWYHSSWNWHVGAGWGWSFGWGYSPWYAGWHAPHWHHHHHHWGGWHHPPYHGHHWAGGGWHRPFNGGYRNAVYTDRNGNGRGTYVPRATGPARAGNGVRAGASRASDRVASSQSGGRVRRASGTERVYNRPSSTRSNVTRTGVNKTNTRDTRNPSVNRTTRSGGEKRQQGTVRKSRENSNGNKGSSYNRSSSSERRQSVDRSNSGSRSNSRSSFGSGGSSRGSGFSGGGSRNGGGSRSGGGSRGGGGRR